MLLAKATPRGERKNCDYLDFMCLTKVEEQNEKS